MSTNPKTNPHSLMFNGVKILAKITDYRINQIWNKNNFVKVPKGFKTSCPLDRIHAFVLPETDFYLVRKRLLWKYRLSGRPHTNTKTECVGYKFNFDPKKISAFLQPFERTDGTLGYFIFIREKENTKIDYDLQHEFMHIVEQENGLPHAQLTKALEKHLGIR